MRYLRVFRVTIESLEKIDEAGRWGRRGCLLLTESQLHRRWRFLCGFITIVGAYSWLVHDDVDVLGGHYMQLCARLNACGHQAVWSSELLRRDQ